MVDWQDLRFFAALAKGGSFSAAARLLDVDHATVARRLDSLERALGLRLVDRLPRSRSLTEDGERVAEMAAQIEGLVGRVETFARRCGMEVSGTVTVSVPPTLGMHVIAPRLPLLRDRHPALRLVLLPSLDLAALDKGEADVALRTVRPQDERMLCQRVGTVRFGLFATEALAASPTEHLTFIGYHERYDHLPQQQWLHTIRGQRPVVFAAGDLATQQAAARQGIGAVVLPCSAGDSDPMLRRVEVETPAPERALWMTVYPELRKSMPVKTVMAFLQECLGVSGTALGD